MIIDSILAPTSDSLQQSWLGTFLFGCRHFCLHLSFLDHLFIKSTKYAVDELAGGVPAKSFAQLHRFVDGHFGRNFFGVQEFKNAKAQNVSINCGDLLNRPLRRGFFNDLIYIFNIFLNAFGQIVDKFRVAYSGSKIFNVSLGDFGQVPFAAVKIPLVEGLHGNGSGKVSIGHNF